MYRELRRTAVNKKVFLTAANNIKKNSWLLLSTIATLSLYLSPTRVSIKMLSACFLIILVIAAFDFANTEIKSKGYTQAASIVLTILLAVHGFNDFWETWIPSTKLAALADSIGMPNQILLLIVGMIVCMAGAYSMYILSCWISVLLKGILDEIFPLEQKNDLVGNLRRNWFFPVSVVSFFMLYASMGKGYILGMVVDFLLSVVVCARIPSIWNKTKNSGIVIRVISAATAVGICMIGQLSYYRRVPQNILELQNSFPPFIDVAGVVSVLVAAAAIYFVYCCVLLFWGKMLDAFYRTGLFSGINITEWIIYGLIFVVVLGFVLFSFAHTEAFYGTEFPYDIIYTSDSPKLVKENVYLSLTNSENDLRQPLFAVFAAPFTGIAYLVAGLVNASAGVQAMLVNSSQIVMLFVAHLMLARMMKLDAVKRICFMVLSSCTYTQLLFSLMMEQYIVAYFWLVFCLYLIVQEGQPERIALWGAGGTLLTSMVLMPFMSHSHPIRAFKAWFLDMVKYGLEFVALLLVFCRFDEILGMTAKIETLSSFTGDNITIMDKIFQYTHFIRNCFAAPAAGVNTSFCEYISWQLEVPSGICIAGVVILLLSAVSAVWNRDKKSSLMAALWVVFSVVMLLGLGWGTAENGLILYALYFGWAFLMLLFQLVERIGDRLGIRLLLPAASILAAALLLAVNVPAVLELIDFAVTYYPV